ncbi:MAG: hypothetical protein PF542_02485 [Nanoarchaeota archaeon]|jgi:BASS family bile acid:Na+ symporter|nr:hypothetical protein [Nanoarchaeota archaeon]
MLNILLKITIAFIMIGIGSSITVQEIKDIFKKKRKITWGLISQIILFPALVFFLVNLSNLSIEYKIGLVILAACPGGTISNFISYIIKADTPLSVALTSVNSIITLITIPLYVKFSLLYFLKNGASIILPWQQLLLEILTLLIIPIAIGIILNHFWDMRKYGKSIKRISSILLAIVFTLKFLSSSGTSSFISNLTQLIFWVVMINIAGIFLGYLIGIFNKFPNNTSVTLGIEIGMQNTVLALLITEVILKSPIMGEPILVYAITSFWITFGFAMLLKKDITLKSIRSRIKRIPKNP